VRGTVQRVIAPKNRVVVSGVNVVKKHQRPQPTGGRQTQGGIIEFEAPISASNVMLVCPHTGEPTRIGLRRDEDGKAIRYSKRSGKDID
jgi:large subunit ribosomal protein L24